MNDPAPSDRRLVNSGPKLMDFPKYYEIKSWTLRDTAKILIGLVEEIYFLRRLIMSWCFPAHPAGLPTRLYLLAVAFTVLSAVYL